MPRALGFGFNLQRIVTGTAYVVVASDGGERAKGAGNGRPPGPQPRVYPGDGTAACGQAIPRSGSPSTRMWVLREPAYPAVSTTLPGSLVLNVQVELLHHALFEVEILRLNRSREGGGIWLATVKIGRKPARKPAV